MWYFSWVLGVGLASTFGILNAMWFEMKQGRQTAVSKGGGDGEGKHHAGDADRLGRHGAK
jgi:cyd operon protein YbgT